MRLPQRFRLAPALSPALATALATACLLACASCGEGPTVPGGPSVDPEAGPRYVGPLYVGPSGHRRDQIDGGAAARVVDCRTRVAAGGFSPGDDYDGETFDSPDQALTGSSDGIVFDGASSGFRTARVEPTRVLFTYDVDGATTQAVIVHDGPAIDGRGWYVESWARCDLAEFPQAVVRDVGTQLWTDDEGEPVDTRLVVSYPGPEHCDWQDSTFLELGRATYVRNPPRDLVASYFTEDWSAHSLLPGHAVDTGYRRGDAELWLSRDSARAYVVDRAGVEMWPREQERLGCA